MSRVQPFRSCLTFPIELHLWSAWLSSSPSFFEEVTPDCLGGRCWRGWRQRYDRSTDRPLEMVKSREAKTDLHVCLLRIPWTVLKLGGLQTFKVVNYKNLHFNDFGDRVAQLLHVESVVPLWPYRNNNSSILKQQMLILNTHLFFPHDYSLCIICLRQCTDGDADAHKWVSHRNHRGNICGVDFIWLLNPNKHRKPLKSSWNHAVFAMIKYLLQGELLSAKDAFAYLKANDFVTFSCFCQALSQLGLSVPYGLASEEM